MVLGITGLYASGKDTAANYLVGLGFDHFSLSDILRAEASKRKIEVSRENLIKLGTLLKEKEGYDVLAKKALARIKGDTVITSIRHPFEVRYLQSHLPNFNLIVIEASPKLCYQRAVARARSGDSISSFKEFIQAENQERAKGGGQEFDAVFKLKNFLIKNDGSFADLHRQIDQTLSKIKEQNG